MKLISKIAGIFFLLIGCMIYLFLRPADFLLFDLISKVSYFDFIFIIRMHLIDLSEILPRPVLFSLPNALWTISGILFLEAIWNSKNPLEIRTKHKHWFFWILFSIILELGQKSKLIPGTFDFIDLLFLIVGILITLITLHFIRRFECHIVTNAEKK